MAILRLKHNVEIYYEVIGGSNERPYLVFLHEALGCTEMWKGFPALLCGETGHPGIVYDRVGHGKSSGLLKSRTLHYMHEHALEELPTVLTALIPGQQYILIGHSDGGSIALIHASAQPPDLKGIITEAAHIFVEEKTVQGVRAATEAFLAGKMGGLFRYHTGKTEKVFRAWSETWLSEWFQSWNIENLLPSIACPALILQGSEDQYGTIAQVKSIASKVPMAQEKMLEGCGHASHKDRSEAVTQVMAKFLGHRYAD